MLKLPRQTNIIWDCQGPWRFVTICNVETGDPATNWTLQAVGGWMGGWGWRNRSKGHLGIFDCIISAIGELLIRWNSEGVTNGNDAFSVVPGPDDLWLSPFGVGHPWSSGGSASTELRSFFQSFASVFQWSWDLSKTEARLTQRPVA